MSKIIKNQSKGYNYHYASLSDIAKQEVEIPKMRIKVIEGKEYIEYYDAELKEWELGARVLPIEMKGSNICQAYGSSITYARRFTTQLATGIACDDDKEVENKDNEVKAQKATASQIEIISKNIDKVKSLLKDLEITRPSELKKLTLEQASHLCKVINEGK